MTKLNGTSGQLFAGLAESLNSRGMSRSAKTSGAKSAEDSSFHDLLHTVSNLAKRALNDQGSDATVKAGTLRTSLAKLTERDGPSDETVHEHSRTAREPKSQDKQTRLDDAAKADLPTRVSLPTIVGQELAAAPAAMPQVQPDNDKRDTPARDERSSAKREVQGTSAAKAAASDAGPSEPRAQASAPRIADVASSEPRTHASALQATQASPATAPQSGSAAPNAASGFEAVTANVERAAKASAREALPEVTKVTVVQQETHLPPVPQFSATQQVANAVVSELKGSPAPAASAAPDLASPQGNPDQPLKILTINLEPPALGNVTVRLRLVGTEVSVHLAAERKDTSQMLDQQRDSIRELMQSAGYVADVAPVQHGSLDGFQAGSGQSQSSLSGQQQQSSQSQGAFNGSSTSSGQSEGGARQDRQDRQPNQETRHDQDVAPHIRRGPVYL
ncbi:flagellar hook-length control protein FliK [Bradyrhizobium neotropicale]|uniref:Flagellar hook-length control protein FliK n=1 Tax=Bradyrhizobium neotropicale TaxID=1497615 RepID=A0A176YK34_9BRAD|nr:flagellar hook-length control protein FliK [Bradyrhizobium neotropicale]OAF07346.1 flagellar hook-length control protein FliK [Bradyrhizobium neotropicale]